MKPPVTVVAVYPIEGCPNHFVMFMSDGSIYEKHGDNLPILRFGRSMYLPG